MVDIGPPQGAISNNTFRLVLYDALASEAMGTLTTGVFLAGFAVELGASNVAIGVLAAVPFAVQFLQLPAVALVERLRSRRAISAWAAGIGRSFLIAAAAAPFLGATAGIVTLVVSIALYQAMAAIAGCAWNSWMRDLVPESEYGRFFGRRAAATTALATALALLSGLLIDSWKRLVPGHSAFAYSCLFIASAVIGLFGVWLLSITPDQPMPLNAQRTHILTLLKTPFSDTNFRRLIVFLSSWNFAANLAAPFFAVYMLKTLGYSMTVVIGLTTASQLSNLAALGLWGNLIDRFSNKAVLGISAPLFLVCTLAWTFTGLAWVRPATLYLLLVVHVLMGIATAGVALASGNIAMKLSPAGQATAYLAASSVVSATCAAMAPVIGGFCADFFSLEATPRATSSRCTNREHPLVTRHALRSSHAATQPLRRMRQYTLFAKISATELNMSRGQLSIHAPPGEKSHSTSPRQLQRRYGFAVTTTEQNFKSP